MSIIKYFIISALLLHNGESLSGQGFLGVGPAIRVLWSRGLGSFLSPGAQGCQMSDLPDRKLKICPRENVCPRDLWSNCPNLNQNLSENQCSKQNLLLSKSSKTVRIETQIWPNGLKNAWQPCCQHQDFVKLRVTFQVENWIFLHWWYPQCTH